MPPLATMPVLILCGGLGTRLRPAVSDRPKSLAPVGDRSFLELQIELLRGQGASHFVMCVGHRANQVREAFGDGRRLGLRIDYSEEGEALLGTGGALRHAARFIAPAAVVVNGDTYLDFDHNDLVRRHESARADCGAVATLTVARLPDAKRYGSVELNPTGEYVAGFREKPCPSSADDGWLNAGAYVIERELADLAPLGVAASLERDLIPLAIRSGRRVAALTSDRPFYDIGTPEDYRAFADMYEGARRLARDTPAAQ